MRINSLSAKNFRTLHEVTVQFGRNYSTISGKNNAGKSAIIRLLEALFIPRQATLLGSEPDFVYAGDRTQWAKEGLPIEIDYQIELTTEEDPALIAAIGKLADKPLGSSPVMLTVRYAITRDDHQSVRAAVNGEAVEDRTAKEIDTRIKNASLLFLHNSTRQPNAYALISRRAPFYDFVLSQDEKKRLDKSEKSTVSKLRQMTKQHTQGLGALLGRLSEKYTVEATPMERYSSRRMPIGINLRDKTVDVPLGDWGSGTQNRTQILAALLHASRVKQSDSPDEKITPFVVVEEPESFLHPSAQAEFGRVLRGLATEAGIQLIVTTHSPHMLNHEEPAANLLLARQRQGRKVMHTAVVSSSAKDWMAPFAEHLGLGVREFENVKPLFASASEKVLLVEGPIDKEYFDYLKTHSLQCERLSNDIEVVAYGGRDTLTNTLLLKFVLDRFENLFITFDLDAQKDCSRALISLGLKEGSDFVAIGVPGSGRECIEGILPPCIISEVMGKHAGLAMTLMGGDNKASKSAKAQIKREMLAAFKAKTDYNAEDLRDVGKLVRLVNRRLQ